MKSIYNILVKLDNVWLTLTWDVLKYIIKAITETVIEGLTLTWDVLKYIYLARFKRVTPGLTLTWDVLK